MNKSCISSMLFCIAAFIIFTSGCAQSSKKDVPLIPEPNVAATDFGSAALEASGSLGAWKGTMCVEADCTVAFYHADGSFYLTTQHHEIFPLWNLIRVSGKEAQGQVSCELSGGKFKASQGAKIADNLPWMVSFGDYMQGLLYLTTSPLRVAEKSGGFAKNPSPIRIEGAMHYALQGNAAAANWSRLVVYQDCQSLMPDMLWFVSKDSQGKDLCIAVRGFNYQPIAKNGLKLPAKVEFYITGADGVRQKKLIEVNYYSLSSSSRLPMAVIKK